MKIMTTALRMLLFMTALTGIGYPLLVTSVGQFAFPHQASGSFLKKNGVIIGSALVAQNFENPKYFWPRPSAGFFNPLPSGGSNLNWISDDLKKTVGERRAKLVAAHNGQPPQDLLFASGSGLDPEVSPEAARYQAYRVAQARGLDEQKVIQFVEKFIEMRQFGVFGESRVNVLKLNVALDESFGG